MSESDEKMTGRVKWFDSELNYGFIEGDDGESYFVHYNEIVCWPNTRSHRHLRWGDKVHFQIGPPSREGSQPQALNVEVTLPVEELEEWE